MIVVLGGGFTGLSVGLELARRGADFRVLEARDEPGGVIRSRRVEGHLLDWGPQRARLTPGIAALVDGLELEDQVVTPPPGLPLLVYRAGKLRPVPFSPGALLRTDLLGPWAKLRILLEPFTRGPDEAEAVGTYLRRKLGRAGYAHLAGPLYGGLYGSDPDDMVMGLSLGNVLEHFGVGRSLLLTLLRKGGRVDPPTALSFREGMQTLPRAMARALGSRLSLGLEARSLERDGAGWRIDTDDGPVRASAVVVTLPAPATAALLRTELPEAAGRIESLRYNPLGVVHLYSDADLRGLGFQVSLAEDLPLKGVTFNHSLFGRTGVYTAYLGGAGREDVVALSDDRLAALAEGQFRLTTGAPARTLAVAREAMPAWDRSWWVLRGLELPPTLHLATNWLARPGLPGRLADAARAAAAAAGDPSRRLASGPASATASSPS